MMNFGNYNHTNVPQLRITIIVNESSNIPSPSYQIRLKPLYRYLQKSKHIVNEVKFLEFLQNPFFSDVIIFQRFISEDVRQDNLFLSIAIQELRNNCKTLVWDIDDDLLELAFRDKMSEIIDRRTLPKEESVNYPRINSWASRINGSDLPNLAEVASSTGIL
jgi:hypothetical protein